jgi:hypothetical protein
MADLAESGQVPHGIHKVMRSAALRLVDDKRAVEGCRLWLPGHGEVISCQ